MKKMVIAGSIMIATTALLVQCKNNKNTNNNNTTHVGDTKKMSRIKIASGLEYEIIQEGTGQETPKPGSMVTVHYTGWLDKDGQPTGQPFDSSHNRREPFTFQIGVGMVIQGWDQGVMTMKVGEKRRLYIPAALGYGSRGAGRVIPGNADLIFDVELISFS